MSPSPAASLKAGAASWLFLPLGGPFCELLTRRALLFGAPDVRKLPAKRRVERGLLYRALAPCPLQPGMSARGVVKVVDDGESSVSWSCRAVT